MQWEKDSLGVYFLTHYSRLAFLLFSQVTHWTFYSIPFSFCQSLVLMQTPRPTSSMMTPGWQRFSLPKFWILMHRPSSALEWVMASLSWSRPWMTGTTSPSGLFSSLTQSPFASLESRRVLRYLASGNSRSSQPKVCPSRVLGQLHVPLRQ